MQIRWSSNSPTAIFTKLQNIWRNGIQPSDILSLRLSMVWGWVKKKYRGSWVFPKTEMSGITITKREFLCLSSDFHFCRHKFSVHVIQQSLVIPPHALWHQPLDSSLQPLWLMIEPLALGVNSQETMEKLHWLLSFSLLKLWFLVISQ